MQIPSKHLKKAIQNEEGFTLVEVIAVLVILGILAAVAIPKFFDMQSTARYKAIQGAVGELNGQIALSFAQNALEGLTPGYCNGFNANIGPDFRINNAINATSGCGADGDIELAQDDEGAYTWILHWNEGTNDSPGYFYVNDDGS